MALAVAGLVWLTYAAAWSLPVAREAARLPGSELPGWQALRVALNPVWAYQGLGGVSLIGAAFSVASGLSNLLMVFAPFVLILWEATPIRAACGWGLVLAAVLNSAWMWPGVETLGLQAGYYLWWSSFLMLGLCVLLRTPRMVLDDG